jgi:hypothetical protein
MDNWHAFDMECGQNVREQELKQCLADGLYLHNITKQQVTYHYFNIKKWLTS